MARALLPKLAEHLVREGADGGAAQRGAAQRGVPRILVYRYPLPARKAASDDGRQAASLEAVAACLSLLCTGHRKPHRALEPQTLTLTLTLTLGLEPQTSNTKSDHQSLHPLHLR